MSDPQEQLEVGHPPLYVDLVITDIHGNDGIGQYVGHGTFTHPLYPVLGQAKITRWSEEIKYE